MAQQTRSGTSRSNGSASTRKSASGNGNSPSRRQGASTGAKGSTTRAKSKSKSQTKGSGEGLPSALKTSAIAGGAAAAGLAGGMMLARKGRLLGLSLPGGGKASVSQNLAEAAKQVGGFGERVGDLANEVRLVREGVSQRRERSPIEVVLEGLTSRRHSR